MITPNRGAQGNALLRRRPRCAHLSGTRRAAASIKPTVRAKTQAVGESVMIVERPSEAIENHFRRAVRHTVVVAIGDEKQLRRAQHPDATVPDLDAGEHL